MGVSFGRKLPALIATAMLATSVSAQEMTSIRIATGLARPVFVDAAPGDMSRVFVVEQRSGTTGRIRIIKDGTLLATPFLSISPVATGNEQGLLGMAFHPDYANNGYIYVNYNRADGDTVIERYTVSGNPDIADPGSGQVVMIVDQPFSNHNAGWIEFGPDGYLYIPLGDGGSGNDPGNRAQNLNNILGKMLRIDVDGDDFPGDSSKNYAIPASNPFVGTGNLEEIWAYGLRNSWRCDFDDLTGDLFIADVGQNAVEEINFQPAASTGGENYGWRCMEGTQCTGLSGCTCNDTSLTLPIYEYSHAVGCSITGGVIYRGSAIDGLAGTYFFSDFCTPRIWTFDYDGNVNNFTDRTTQLTPDIGSIGSIASFGEDAAGEIYICDLGGEIFKVVPAVDPCSVFKKLKGRCKDSGKVKGIAKFTDESLDGRTVTFMIGEVAVQTTVSGRTAKADTCCFNGAVVISLVDPDCGEPFTVNCPG